MSADGPQQTEWLAIAFLVEASLALFDEWNRLFQDYVVQLLQRSNLTSKVTRVAFITYGTADTYPSPIVKKIYFTELRFILQDIMDDRKRLGMGETDSGGGKGMAALEGFATILDMFDFLRTVAPKDLECRVVHIAASPPDSSEHPQWNTSPSFDSLTWEHLPTELKKRNIQLSGINTSIGLNRFPELYKQSATDNHTPPWFSVRAQDHVHLNGFALASAPLKGKRAGEPVAVERTPEIKRAKIASVQSTADKSPPPGQKTISASPMLASSSDATEQSSQPSNQPSSQPSNQPPTQTPTQTPTQPPTQLPTQLPTLPPTQLPTQPPAQPPAQPPTQPPTQPPAQPSAPPHPSQQTANPQVIQLFQRVSAIVPKKRQLEEDYNRLLSQKQAAIARGNAEAAASCDQQLNIRKEQLTKVNQYLNALQQHVRQAQLQSQTNTTGQDSSQAAQTGLPTPAPPRTAMPPSAAPQGTFNSTPVIKHRSTPSMQSPTHNDSTMPSATPNPGLSSPATNPTSHMAPAVLHTTPNFAAAQIHNPNEASRHRPGSIGPSMSPRMNGPANVAEAGIPHNNNSNNNGGVQQPQGVPAPQPVLVWEGILSFNGTGSDGQKKEVHTGVSASSSNASNSHSESWPPSLTLAPAQTPAVSIQEFQEWIRRTKPVLCTFKARGPEDEANYQMLVSVMSTKKMYATASWMLPNGVLKENVLIFPINNMGLCGAFFPLSGIPEMPKANAPSSIPPSSSSIPPAIVQLIGQLPPDQRNSIIMQIRRQVAAGQDPRSLFEALMQRSRQQMQNRAAMANHFGLNSNMAQLGAMGNGMNMMNMNAMNANGMNPFGTMANPPAMLSNMNRTATGSGGSGTSMNLNYDVLQSFMQRNHPDGNNNSSGMGLG